MAAPHAGAGSGTDASGDDSGADLRLERLSKRWGDVVGVAELDLTIPAGSFFALLGPSGCGKTTTLRMVAGLERPTSGVIRIGGQDVTGTRAHERPVNTVFQSYALFPHLDVLENVAFGLRRRRRRDAVAAATEALELVELAHCARRKPTQLSGGQQQRVALARALVNRPAVLLLDEPLGALDLKLRRQMQVELKGIQTEVGLTFVHVTHDQEEAMTMADTVAVMNHGRIEQIGPPAELYERPATAFVANFLGQSNLVPGRVVGRRGSDLEIRLQVPGEVLVHCPSARAASGDGDVVVGVRPEKVRLLRTGETAGDGDNVVGPGTVVDVAFSGVSTQYLVQVPGAGALSVFSQNLDGVTVPAGTQVSLAWSVDRTFVLVGAQNLAAGRDLQSEDGAPPVAVQGRPAPVVGTGVAG